VLEPGAERRQKLTAVELAKGPSHPLEVPSEQRGRRHRGCHVLRRVAQANRKRKVNASKWA
jgi:hypothetical protein